MDRDPIERLLNEDFAKTRADLETDGFAERLLDKIMSKRRVRLAVISVAGAAGAIVAAAQFMKIAGVFEVAEPFVAKISTNAEISAMITTLAPQLLAAGAMAAAFAVTAMIVQGES